MPTTPDAPAGVPAAELTDNELERQGLQAHATRHWAFLHGTSEQFRTHTQRMLELEQEYLRRHPQRTWQGSTDLPVPANREGAAVARDSRIRDLIRTLSAEVLSLLNENAPVNQDDAGPDEQHGHAGVLQARLLDAFAQAPGGTLHKLEAHQIARRVGLEPKLVAVLYKQDPPLLRAAGDDRAITEAGRRWLAAHDAQ